MSRRTGQDRVLTKLSTLEAYLASEFGVDYIAIPKSSFEQDYPSSYEIVVMASFREDYGLLGILELENFLSRELGVPVSVGILDKDTSPAVEFAFEMPVRGNFKRNFLGLEKFTQASLIFGFIGLISTAIILHILNIMSDYIPPFFILIGALAILLPPIGLVSGINAIRHLDSSEEALMNRIGAWTGVILGTVLTYYSTIRFFLWVFHH